MTFEPGDSTGLLMMGTHGVPVEGQGTKLLQAIYEGTAIHCKGYPIAITSDDNYCTSPLAGSPLSNARKIRKLHESLVLGEGIFQNAQDK